MATPAFWVRELENQLQAICHLGKKDFIKVPFG